MEVTSKMRWFPQTELFRHMIIDNGPDLSKPLLVTLTLTSGLIELARAVESSQAVTLTAALEMFLQEHLTELLIWHVVGPSQVGADHHLHLLLTDSEDRNLQVEEGKNA